MPHNCHRYLSTRMNDTLAHIETNHFKNSFINIFSIPFNSYSFFSFLFNLYYRPYVFLRFRRVYVSLCYCMYLCYSSAVHLLIALFYMSHWCDWHLWIKGYLVTYLLTYLLRSKKSIFKNVTLWQPLISMKFAAGNHN